MKYLPYDLSPEELCFFTPQWKGERFPDGRPKVPDQTLDTILKYASITHAWSVCQGAGYHHQFIGGFQSTIPGEAMVGRALTALYLPILPGLREHLIKAGQERGEIGDMISWPIQRLVHRDVYVADVFGKIDCGPIVGERLSTAIYAKSRNGCVHNASVRDIDGIRDIKGFNIFYRGMHPSCASPTIMLGGINCPMRMEGVTVMPGDVVLAKDDCVIFIPAHLAEYCAFSGMIVSFQDQFAMLRCREGVYTSGEIDGAWPEHIEKDFLGWIARQPGVPFSPEDIDRIKGQRLW